MEMMLTLLVALFVSIFAHEMGHYLAARMIGFNIEEFSVGIGPKLIKKSMGGTLFCLRLIPIGGICLIEEIGRINADDIHNVRTLNVKKMWVLISGPLASLLVAILFLSFAGSVTGVRVIEVENDQLIESGISSGYRLRQVGGHRIYRINDIENLLIPNSVNRLGFWDAYGNSNEVLIEVSGSHLHGITFSRDTFLQRVNISIREIGELILVFFESFRGIFTSGETEYIVEDDLQLSSHSISENNPLPSTSLPFSHRANILLIFIGAVSSGIFYFNLLPLVFLDGHKILCSLVPAISGKELTKFMSGVMIAIGVVLVLTYILLRLLQ